VVDLLVESMENDKKTKQRVVLMPELVIRRSTGPAKH